MSDTNLLTETIEILKENGKTLQDIKWIGTADKWIDLNTFVMLADFNYNSGYGRAEINEGLKVVGEDWWLERHEYDGSEWWEFKTMPKKPDNKVGNLNLEAY